MPRNRDISEFQTFLSDDSQTFPHTKGPESSEIEAPPSTARSAVLLRDDAAIDVLQLEPPAELLRQIDAMAKALGLLLDGGAVESARRLNEELRELVKRAEEARCAAG